MRSDFGARRGLTLVEVALIVILVALIGVTVVLFSSGGSHRSPDMKCATQLKQIHQCMLLWSQDHNNEFPLPMVINPAQSMAAHNPGNSTANLHSLMIYNNMYSPELLVCPNEVSPHVAVPQEYNYSAAERAEADSTMYWDANFRCDIDGAAGSWSNVSYANIELTTDFKNTWKAHAIDSSLAMMSDRGPKDGKHDPHSLTYQLHGSRRQWQGNVAFNDGHVKMLEERTKEDQPFAWPEYTWFDASSSKKMPDNLFFRDDPGNKSDSWLAVFTSATGEEIGGTKVAWD